MSKPLILEASWSCAGPHLHQRGAFVDLGPLEATRPRQAFARGLTGEEEEEEISEEEGVAASGATSPSILI